MFSSLAVSVFIRASFVLMADVNLNQSLQNICNLFAAVVGGASALAYMRAGYLWMFSDSSPMGESKARHAFSAAIVGSVICLGAVTIANLVTGAIH
jgi:cytochrome bd-type quinol oxidase subunit 2